MFATLAKKTNIMPILFPIYCAIIEINLLRQDWRFVFCIGKWKGTGIRMYKKCSLLTPIVRQKQEIASIMPTFYGNISKTMFLWCINFVRS